jgi:hypothetical protein
VPAYTCNIMAYSGLDMSLSPNGVPKPRLAQQKEHCHHGRPEKHYHHG